MNRPRSCTARTLQPVRSRGLLAAVAAGKHQVQVEDLDFSYGLYAEGVRAASFAEGRIGYRGWARRNGRLGRDPQPGRPLRTRRRRAYGLASLPNRPTGAGDTRPAPFILAVAGIWMRHFANCKGGGSGETCERASERPPSRKIRVRFRNTRIHRSSLGE